MNLWTACNIHNGPFFFFVVWSITRNADDAMSRAAQRRDSSLDKVITAFKFFDVKLSQI